MFGIKKIIIVTAGKAIGRWAKLALSLFFIQFFGAAYLLYTEIAKSSEIFGVSAGQIDNDLVTYHYFRTLLLVPIVALSLVFSLVGFFTKWEFDFEQEIIEVFIIINWLILGFMSLFLK